MPGQEDGPANESQQPREQAPVCQVFKIPGEPGNRGAKTDRSLGKYHRPRQTPPERLERRERIKVRSKTGEKK